MLRSPISSPTSQAEHGHRTLAQNGNLRNERAAEAPKAGAKPFSITPLLFEGFASTMSLMAFVALVGPIARLLGLAPWQVGVAVTLAGAAWALCARYWGRASDQLGRRRVMLIGLAGFGASYALLCLFLDAALRFSMPAIVAFLGLTLFRTLAGAFYAAVPASSIAVIADHYGPRERAEAIAGLGAANGLGMVLGPAAAGLLAQFGMTAPLVFIVALPAIAFVVIWRGMPSEAARRAKSVPLQLTDQRLRWPLAIALIAMMCTGVAQICVSFYALDRLGLTPTAAVRVAGFALGAVGLALLSAQVFVRALRWSELRLIQVGAVIAGFGFGTVTWANNEALLLSAYFVGALGMGFIFPAFYALAANAVEPHEQGEAAGAISSVQGLGSILGPITGTLVYQINVGAPYVLIAVLLIAVALLMRLRAPSIAEPLEA